MIQNETLLNLSASQVLCPLFILQSLQYCKKWQNFSIAKSVSSQLLCFFFYSLSAKFNICLGQMLESL